jgi:hypothetical protein
MWAFWWRLASAVKFDGRPELPVCWSTSLWVLRSTTFSFLLQSFSTTLCQLYRFHRSEWEVWRWLSVVCFKGSGRVLFYGNIREFSTKDWGKTTRNLNTLPTGPNLNRVLIEFEAGMATTAPQQRTNRAKSMFIFPFDNGNLRTTVHRMVESVKRY